MRVTVQPARRNKSPSGLSTIHSGRNVTPIGVMKRPKRGRIEIVGGSYLANADLSGPSVHASSRQLSAQAPTRASIHTRFGNNRYKGLVPLFSTSGNGLRWRPLFISDPYAWERIDPRLVHIDANGAVVSQNRLPLSIAPPFPEVSQFAIATSALAACSCCSHSHCCRSIYFDGAILFSLKEARGERLKR